MFYAQSSNKNIPPFTLAKQKQIAHQIPGWNVETAGAEFVLVGHGEGDFALCKRSRNESVSPWPVTIC